MVSDFIWTIVTALWAILPAYLPNSVAVLVSGGTPFDGGRMWRGHRLLGDDKTWCGAIGSSLAGFSLALAMNAVRSGLSPSLPIFLLSAAVALPVGTMIRDVAGSFVKRRTCRERGDPFPAVDQLRFVIGALVLSLLLAPSWTLMTFTPPVILGVLVVTPLVDFGTNGGAYLLGLKDEPW